MSTALTNDEIKALASLLKDEFARGATKQMVFRLKGPTVATVKRSDGQYRKNSFVGDEEFRLSTAYAGKRNGVIIVFTPKSPVTDYAQMEMGLEEALKNMGSNFSDFITPFVGKTEEKVSQEKESRERRQAQIQNETRAQYLADPRYGAF